jgi:hypothetical protein
MNQPSRISIFFPRRLTALVLMASVLALTGCNSLPALLVGGLSLIGVRQEVPAAPPPTFPTPTPASVGQLPPSTPLPAASSPSARILSFNVDSPANAREGDLITVRWQTTGVEWVSIYMNYLGEPRTYSTPTYPANGELLLNLPYGAKQVTITLSLPENRGMQSVTLRVACQLEWFAGAHDSCPSAVKQTTAVYQPFEEGFILRLPEIDRIWKYENIFDSFHVTPNDDSYFDIHVTMLGAPLADPVTFTMTYQQTPWGVGTKGSSYTVLQLPDGRIYGRMIAGF